jgi:hypothetical protein
VQRVRHQFLDRSRSATFDKVSVDEVTIGEDANTVHLTHAQWNDLVSRIQKGELAMIG